MKRSSHDRAAQLKVLWRQHVERLNRKEIEPNLRLGLAASFTVNSLVPFVGGPLIEAGFSPSVQLGPYHQLFQVCLDHRAYFPDPPDVIVLLFRLEDLMFEDLVACLQGEKEAWTRAVEKIDLLVSACRTLRDAFSGTLVISLPPFPSILPVDLLDLNNPLGLGALHRELLTCFLDRAGTIPGLRFCDLDAVERECGRSASFDSRQWALYRQPFTDVFLEQAGSFLARLVEASRRPSRKCVVLDCDNTLWGGVIGEDGMAGIQLGDEFPGTVYRDFQRLLLHWRGQGVLLALASKNNEADVWEVFDQHDGMLLRREHLSAWEIHWKPKSESIPLLAQALHIGIDSLVFIDDSALEIEQMRQAWPEVASVLLPEDPADFIEELHQARLFDRLDVTPDDRHRADRMQDDQRRAAAGTGLSPEEFRKSLELRLDFFRAQPEDLDRIAQLINKTNQFNLSTIRRSLDEVRALAQSARHGIFGLRVADRFGDYGLTGVVILHFLPDEKEALIDTFLLSCRVLGRGVETALLAAVTEEARAVGAESLVAAFIPTPKNGPAASFLSDHHFQEEKPSHWRIAVSQMR